MNHPAYVNIYIDVRRGRKEGRKTERLPLEAKIEAETVEKEDETVSEIVEQKLKLWESKSGEGKGTKPETKRGTRRQEVVTVKKHQGFSWKGFGCGLGLYSGIKYIRSGL